MEPSWSTFLFQHLVWSGHSLEAQTEQANEALHHQHQPPVSVAELLKDNVASGTGGGGGGGLPHVVVKKEQKTKTPFICGYCNKAFRDSYHLRRHESCHTGVKMVSRPKKAAQTAPTMVPHDLHRAAGEQQRWQPLLHLHHRWHPHHGDHLRVHRLQHHVGHAHGQRPAARAAPPPPPPPAAAATRRRPKEAPKPVKKNHGCDMCGKAFRDVYHLNRHKLSHSDEKPFECPICQQRFKRKDRMTYHVRSHDGGINKPYICSVCGKGFSRCVNVLLQCRGGARSLRRRLGWEEEEETCVGLTGPDHLSCHVKHVHSTERPFKCQVTACTAAFATKDRLRSHMIRHEGKVTCNICGKMLSAAYITSHLKTHGQTSFNTSCNKDTNNVCSSATPVTAAITTAMNRGNVSSSNPVTIAAQMNITTNTVNIARRSASSTRSPSRARSTSPRSTSPPPRP
ncbi:hypothetical protein AAFF_G00347990 [Aldrovandia affinis]|uniref:C2H2-type domain-containing protein n=1 Tax=Aldrovandia affinis TaxID=143900 RepID=A0AAD7WNU3_9TELE|nr:hypothetical protein AAFF_G00347990 [Aldrovandia affinis]